MALPILGIITTGTGPRTEYDAYHKKFLSHLGVEVEVIARHALDNLSREEVRELEAGPNDNFIGCHIKMPGGRGDRMGDDWGHVWIAHHKLVPIYQKYIDELESLGVSATILCCAEEYGVNDFRSKRFFVQPWIVMTEYVRIQTLSMSRPKIGLLIPDEEHRRQDIDTWTSQPWMEKLELIVESKKGRLDAALESFRKAGVDLVLNWGYGYGIAPRDPDNALAYVEEKVGAPFITTQRIATLSVRDLLQPSINDRLFV